MRTFVDRAWSGMRDRFSSAVLGTTSSDVPGLQGGLSRTARLSVTALSLGLAFLVALAIGSPWGSFAFFPALMIAGIFGGVELALPALAIAIFIAVYLFPTLNDGMFATFAAVQTAVALGLRLLFRESRRWGVRYRRLLSSTSSAVTVSDAAGRIERPHPELEKLLGMPWPAYAGNGWLSAIHPDDRKLMTPPNSNETHRAEIRLKDPHDGSWRWHMMRAVPLADENGKPEEWISVLTDIHDRKLLAEQREVTIGEARHRLKNLITIIESLAKSSRPAEKDQSVEAFLDKYLGRLRALTAASDLALASNYSTMQAEDVARATLAPFLESGRITIGGPKLELSEAIGGGLAMGLNELATNAIKYGALSGPGGRVTWSWTVTPEGDQDRVVMEWREQGGPPPMPPAKEGYGARVIRFVGSRANNGKVEMLYPPEGYICRIEFTRPHKPRVPTLEND